MDMYNKVKSKYLFITATVLECYSCQNNIRKYQEINKTKYIK